MDILHFMGRMDLSSLSIPGCSRMGQSGPGEPGITAFAASHEDVSAAPPEPAPSGSNRIHARSVWGEKSFGKFLSPEDEQGKAGLIALSGKNKANQRNVSN